MSAVNWAGLILLGITGVGIIVWALFGRGPGT